MSVRAAKYILFHRHGQRAPTRNIAKPLASAPATGQKESASPGIEDEGTWLSQLPPSSVFDRLNSHFSVTPHPENPRQRDLTTRPYGCITTTGVRHMYLVGKGLAMTFPDLAASLSGGQVRVRATNYQRTQVSVQALLLGATGLPCPVTEASMNADSTAAAEGGSESRIFVEATKRCSMAFYEGRQDLAIELVRVVQGTPSYQALEQGRLPSFAVLDEGAAIGDHDLSVEMAQAVEEMASHFPGLMRRPLTATNPNSDGNSSSSSSTSASTGATAVAFDWLVANDYFACRTANALEDTIPGSLLRHEAIVRCILAHRYGLYFAHPTKSAHFAVPLLVDILESLGEGQTSTDTKADSETDTGGVDVYSCHDVNLLGMLFALRCPLVTHPNGYHGHPVHNATHRPVLGSVASVRRVSAECTFVWPDYGSTLVLRRQYEQGNAREAGGDGSTSSRQLSELGAAVREKWGTEKDMVVEIGGKCLSALLEGVFAPSAGGSNDAAAVEFFLEGQPLALGIGSGEGKRHIVSIGDLKRQALELLLLARTS